MNRIIPAFIMAFAILFASSCNNDINTDAEFKEIMVVYGLLNTNDTVHYIRVNKAFLTNGQSAIEVARNHDKVFFDSLDVVIEEYDVGSSTPIFRTSYKLQKDESLAKDTGVFANYPNVLYSLKQKLNENYEYKVIITNKLTGNIATATTRLVHDPTLSNPSLVTNLYLIDPTRNLSFSWTGGRNAKVYDMNVRFYWDEYDSATNQVIDSNLFIDWNVVGNKETSISGSIRSNVPGKNFFSFISSQLPYQVGKYRVPKKIDFIYWAADDELFLYRKVNTPSVGIVQAKPEYTNLNSGNFGIIASRNRFVIPNVSVSPKTATFLRTDPNTSRLKFREP
jgi:hypothetical protein